MPTLTGQILYLKEGTTGKSEETFVQCGKTLQNMLTPFSTQSRQGTGKNHLTAPFTEERNLVYSLCLLTLCCSAVRARGRARAPFQNIWKVSRALFMGRLLNSALGFDLMGSRSEPAVLSPQSSPLTVHSHSQGPHHLHMGVVCPLWSLWMQYFQITMLSLSNSADSSFTLGSWNHPCRKHFPQENCRTE